MRWSAKRAWRLNIDEGNIISTDAVMNEHTLPAVEMPNRHGFVPDDRPDVEAAQLID